MALSLSGPGTPPLCWEGGSRGRGPFQNSTFLPGLGGIQGVGRLFHGELQVFLSPQPPSKQRPHPQRQFQSTPAPAPGSQKRNHKRYLSTFPFTEAKGPGIPLPPSQSSGGQRVPLETTSWCPSQCAPMCGGRGLRVSAQVSCLAVGGPDTCAWCACVCTSWCAPVWSFLCASGCLLASSGLSVSLRVSICAFLRACTSWDVCHRVCVCPCVCHRAWVPQRINPPRVASPAGLWGPQPPLGARRWRRRPSYLWT